MVKYKYGYWLILVFLMTFGMGFTKGQSWSELNNQALLLYQQGKYMQAAISGEKALTVAVGSFGATDIRLADSFYSLALITQGLGKYPKAIEYYTSSILIREKSIGNDNNIGALCYLGLGELNLEMDQIELAEKQCQQALVTFKKVYGVNHSEVGNTLRLLVKIYLKQGKVKDAEQTASDALNIITTINGNDHPKVGEIYIMQSQINSALKQETQAKVLVQKAIELLKKIKQSDSAIMGEALFQQGILEKLAAKYSNASIFFKQAQKIFEKTIGPNHPLIAETLWEQAESLKLQKKYKQTFPLYRKAEKIWSENFGLENLCMARAQFSQGETYDLMGSYRKAEFFYNRVQTLRRKVLGRDNLDVAISINCLIEQYLIQKEFDQAEPLCQEAHQIAEKITNSDVVLGTTLNLQGRINIHRGDLTKAADNIQKALEIMQKNYPDNHVAVAKCLENKAKIATILGQYKEAETLFKKIKVPFEKFYGRSHPYILVVLEDMRDLYQASGKSEETRKLEQQITKIRQQIKKIN